MLPVGVHPPAWVENLVGDVAVQRGENIRHLSKVVEYPLNRAAGIGHSAGHTQRAILVNKIDLGVNEHQQHPGPIAARRAGPGRLTNHHRPGNIRRKEPTNFLRVIKGRECHLTVLSVIKASL